ncbi:hypothetical protein [Streptomyces sp. NPDC051183]|uniref:hypothetical protein n=1 Tax=unclassified Streptomyces TaxID=2593676 RepID=UPI0034421896
MPLLVVAGLLLGPTAPVAAAVPVARQSTVAATAFVPGALPAAGAGSVTGVQAPVSYPEQAVAGDKKSDKSKKKKKKKSGGLFKKLLIVAVVVIVLLVVLYGIRRALRRRSS